MLRNILIFIMLSHSFLLVANQPHVDDEFSVFLRDYHFEIQGINFFFSDATIDEVANVFGDPKVLYQGDDMHATFMFCYISTSDGSGIIFGGISDRIEWVRIVHDFKEGDFLSGQSNQCASSEKMSIDVKTKGGLSLLSNKNDIFRMFGKNIKFDQERQLYKISVEGIMLSPEGEPTLIRGECSRPAVIYDASIYIKFVDDSITFITLTSTIEGIMIGDI